MHMRELKKFAKGFVEVGLQMWKGCVCIYFPVFPIRNRKKANLS